MNQAQQHLAFTRWNIVQYFAEKLCLALFMLLLIVMMLLVAPLAHAEGKIVKWKDANGVTHYGDKIPAQEAGRSNSVLSNQGTVVKKNDPFNPRADAAAVENTTAKLAKQDSALLASYSSAHEIDIALDRNLKSDQLAIDLLRQRQSDILKALAQTNEKIKTKYTNKPVPAYLIEQVEEYKTQNIKKKSEIARLENNILLTKERFAKYKSRYLELNPQGLGQTEVNASKISLEDLLAWKVDATNRLNGFKDQAKSYQRSNAQVPSNLSLAIQQTTDEIAQVDKEIARAKGSLNKSEQTSSK